MFYNKDDNRILWVDWIKAIAIISVVMIHVSDAYVNINVLFTPDAFFTLQWFVAVFYRVIANAAVPLFIMVSGFLILRKPEPISNIPHRLKRILIPFAFFLLLMCIFNIGISDVLGLVKYYLNGLVNATIIENGAYFWFVYIILALYLFAPILSKWISNSKFSEIEYFLIICAIVMSVYTVKLLTGYSMAAFDYLANFGSYTGYFVLGYYLVFKESKYLKSRKFGLLLLAVGFLINYVGIIVFSYINNAPNTLINGVSCSGTCLLAMGIFIVIKNTNFKKLSNKLNEIAILLSLGSYGGYLIHMFILLLFISNVPLFSLEIIPSLGVTKTLIIIPLLTVLVSVCSYVLVIIISKIPFFKHFSGFKLPKSKNK